VLGTVALSGGRATLTTAALAVGTHSLTVVYNGAPTFTGSTSAAVTIAVAPVRTSTLTSLSASATSLTTGQAVALTATVRPASGGGTLSGTVTFRDGTTVLGTIALSSGRAVFSTSRLAASTHHLTAVYNGATAFAGSTSAAQTVTVTAPVVRAATLTTLVGSAGAAFYGQPVTFTASVRPASGAGSVVVGTVALTNGAASITLSSLRAGNHGLTAVYNGDGRFTASTSAARALTVNQVQAVVNFTLAQASSAVGSTLTLRATVTAVGSKAIPDGQIVFKADAVVLGTVTLDRTGTATLTVTNRLTVGQHWIGVGYFGNASFSPDGSGDLLLVTAR
jgi:hypothetical protein